MFMKARYMSAHKVFEAPPDVNTKIWRYMDFTKFVSLLDRSSLFFIRSDCLDDPFEGTYPLENIRNPQLMGATENAQRQITEVRKQMREYALVNCWHMNEYESAAMWNNKGPYGLAIQSTFDRLRNSFLESSDIQVHIGVVKYIDFRKERFSELNTLYPFIHKRKSFEHEKELRAVIMDWKRKYLPEIRESTLEKGESVEVDIHRLIERIYVSPNSERWYIDLVRSILHKYELPIQVEPSSLSERPVW